MSACTLKLIGSYDPQQTGPAGESYTGLSELDNGQGRRVSSLSSYSGDGTGLAR